MTSEGAGEVCAATDPPTGGAHAGAVVPDGRVVGADDVDERAPVLLVARTPLVVVRWVGVDVEWPLAEPPPPLHAATASDDVSTSDAIRSLVTRRHARGRTTAHR